MAKFWVFWRTWTTPAIFSIIRSKISTKKGKKRKQKGACENMAPSTYTCQSSMHNSFLKRLRDSETGLTRKRWPHSVVTQRFAFSILTQAKHVSFVYIKHVMEWWLCKYPGVLQQIRWCPCATSPDSSWCEAGCWSWLRKQVCETNYRLNVYFNSSLTIHAKSQLPLTQ